MKGIRNNFHTFTRKENDLGFHTSMSVTILNPSSKHDQ